MLDVDEHQIFSPPVFMSPRDTFVASTAVKLEHLQTAIARLEREADEARALISSLAETVEQNHRFYTFQQNEKRLKELRVDELLRCVKDVKSRLDRIEGADLPAVDFSNTTFEAVHHRIGEIARKQARIEAALTGIRLYGVIFFGAGAAAMAVMGFGLV